MLSENFWLKLFAVNAIDLCCDLQYLLVTPQVLHVGLTNTTCMYI